MSSSIQSKKRFVENEHKQHLAPFTIKELRDAVPAHCFERSVIKSSSYVVIDCIVIGLLIFVGQYFDSNFSNYSWIISLVFWNSLWFTQGAFMTGLWVIAHECGHQSFSKWKFVNDSVGWVLHSILLVPYHSWRITHGQHHKSTSHMTRDQVYIPKTFKQVAGAEKDVHNVIAESPLVCLIQITILLTVGWPFYLATNAWGQDYGKRTNHFEPSAPMFKPSQKWEIIISNVGLISVLTGIIYFTSQTSFLTMLKIYGMPYLWVNFWLVLITYLQHTDARVPHFRGEEWTFIRGALSTIDRDYGVLNNILHHIGDTHVAHHLFSTMPHYHAEEATIHLKKILGDYYLTDKTPIMKALWKAWNSCHYVEDEGDILYYKQLNRKAQ